MLNGKIHYFDWAIFNSYVKLPEVNLHNLRDGINPLPSSYMKHTLNETMVIIVNLAI